MNILARVFVLTIVLLVAPSTRAQPRCDTLGIVANDAVARAAHLDTLKHTLSTTHANITLLEQGTPALQLELSAQGSVLTARLRGWADQPSDELVAEVARSSHYDALDNRNVIDGLNQSKVTAFHDQISRLIDTAITSHAAWVSLDSDPKANVTLTAPVSRGPAGLSKTPARFGCMIDGTVLRGQVLFAKEKMAFEATAAASPLPLLLRPSPATNHEHLKPDPKPKPVWEALWELVPKEWWQWLVLAALACLAALLFPKTYKPRMRATLSRIEFDAKGVCSKLELQLVNKNSRVSDMPELTVSIAASGKTGVHTEKRQPSARDPETVPLPARVLEQWQLRAGDNVEVTLAGRFAPSALPFTYSFSWQSEPLALERVAAGSSSPSNTHAEKPNSAETLR